MLQRTCIVLLLFLITPNPMHSKKLNDINNDNKISLEEMISSLFKLLKCIKNTKQIDLSIAFGSTVTAAQLRVAMRHLQAPTSNIIYRILFQMEQMCLNMLDSARPKLMNHSLYKILVPSLWEIDRPSSTRNKLFTNILRGNFTNEDIKPTTERKPWLIKHNPPLGDENNRPRSSDSDTCLKSVLNTCSYDNSCFSVETTDYNYGYATTHQILFWQLFRQLNCRHHVNTPEQKIEQMIKYKCTRVLEEILATQVYDQYDEEDLFLEQVGVCGMEGFKKFLTNDFRYLVRKLQKKNGCFEMHPRLRRELTKKEADYYDRHMCTVGALALVVQIKDMIKSG